MFVSLYYPMFDMRGFFALREQRTKRPAWPSPDLSGTPFQRNLGAIRDRPQGGVRGWVGETTVCEIGRSLTFEAASWPSSDDRIRAVFKRFYADGEGGAQYSFGVPVPKANSRSQQLRRDAIDTILRSRLRSPHRSGNAVLRDAGPLLADLFAGGTTKGNRLAVPSPYVKHGRPLLLLQGLRGSTTANGMTVSEAENISDELLRDLTAQFRSVTPGSVLMIDAAGQREVIRSTRIIVARLYLELFCFERCIALLQSPALATLDDFGKSQLLNRIALSAQRLAGRRAPAGTPQDLYDMLGAAFARVHRPGRIDELDATLRIAGATPNLSRAVLSAVRKTDILSSNIHSSSGVFVQMTNYNNFGQAGAFGENAQASSFIQSWDRQSAHIDLPSLAAELGKLQLALQSEASKGEEHVSVAAIAQAKEAAEAGDGPRMLGHLAKAGKWTLSVAEKIGVGLVVAAIKSQADF